MEDFFAPDHLLTELQKQADLNQLIYCFGFGVLKVRNVLHPTTWYFWMFLAILVHLFLELQAKTAARWFFFTKLFLLFGFRFMIAILHTIDHLEFLQQFLLAQSFDELSCFLH